MIVDNNLDQIYPHQKRYQYQSLGVNSNITCCCMNATCSLPMKFPFCAFIPNCVAIVRHFIKTYYEFSKDLFADTDEFVKKVLFSLSLFHSLHSYTLTIHPILSFPRFLLLCNLLTI